MKRPAVFLDRDNTLIHNDGDLGDPEQVRLIQGAAPAVASLCGLGYRVVVVTNQGGVARGKYGEADVDAVHDRLEQLIKERANGARIDAFYFCPYHPQGTVAQYKKEHPFRKPKPGMLLQAAEDLDLDLSQSWMVGDALRDVDAGGAAGCRTVLLQADWSDTSLADLRKTEGGRSGGLGPKSRKKHEPDFVAKGLVEAVRIIASQRKPEASEEISRTRVAGKRWDAEAMAKLQQPGRSTPAAKDAASGEEGGDPPELDRSAGPGSPKAVAGGRSAAPTRPFVPWTRQAVDVVPTEAAPAPKTESPDAAESAGSAAASVSVVTTSPPAPPAADAARSPSPFAPKAEAQPSVASGPAPAAAVATGSIEQVKRAATADNEAADAVSSSIAEPEEVQKLAKTARLILQELRTQRGSSGEFQQLGVVAIVVQAVALLCMLGALWMGGGDGGDSAFFRWIGVAIVLQLAVIATLLFSRSSA
jgi:D-glycero-D-manno-heptose 1,7-bisphosphate phosphatase